MKIIWAKLENLDRKKPPKKFIISNLFDKYFKDLFYTNGHKTIHHSLREGMKFSDAVKILKNL